MKGLAISPGIGIGKAFLYREPVIEVNKYDIKSIKQEVDRFGKAIEIAKSEIDNLYEISLKSIGKNQAEIFIAHKMMLEDPEFIGEVEKRITEKEINAEWAVSKISNEFISVFENIENEYLRARALDLKDVSKRVLRILLDIEPVDLISIDKDTIIIAEDLTPSDTAQMNKENVRGIITELGGRTSHTSIIARTIDIPAISGVEDVFNLVNPEDLLILNGDTGEIILNPNEKEKQEYTKKQEEIKEFKNKLNAMIGKETISKDNHKVKITGNIGTPKDIDKVIENDGEGVGLFRSEFLYMYRDRLPTEEEQFEAYKSVVQRLQGNPLIIRTLDAGGDKKIPYLNVPKEMNPFLGYRAIRLCLDRLDIFKTQIRAILRASYYGDVKILFPMISSIQEVRESKAIVEEVKEELKEKNISFKEDLEIGIMVEVPAVAIHSKAFAKEVDFFSIGTNDLIQYTLAVDRGNQNLSYLYNQYHPAVLRLIKMTIENGHEIGIWVGMCGEVAGDQKLIPILLAMGLDEFSMSASSILKSRYLIRNTSKGEIEGNLEKILNLSTSKDVEDYINKNILD